MYTFGNLKTGQKFFWWHTFWRRFLFLPTISQSKSEKSCFVIYLFIFFFKVGILFIS